MVEAATVEGAVMAEAITVVPAVALVLPSVARLALSVLPATAYPTRVGTLFARGVGPHSRPQGAVIALVQRLRISQLGKRVKLTRQVE